MATCTEGGEFIAVAVLVGFVALNLIWNWVVRRWVARKAAE